MRLRRKCADRLKVITEKLEALAKIERDLVEESAEGYKMRSYLGGGPYLSLRITRRDPGLFVGLP